jgi:hypothetical protein
MSEWDIGHFWPLNFKHLGPLAPVDEAWWREFKEWRDNRYPGAKAMRDRRRT